MTDPGTCRFTRCKLLQYTIRGGLMKKNFSILTISLLTLFFLTNAIASPNIAKIYSPEDILAFKRVDQVVASPDGKSVAFVVRQVKSTSSGKQWEYSLYLQDSQKKVSMLLKSKKIGLMIWSPDGKQIAYLVKGKQYQGIWIDTINDNKINKFFEFGNDILSFKFSPNGKFIAFTAEEKKKTTKGLTPNDVSKNYTNTQLYLLPIKPNTTAIPLTSENYSVSQFFTYPGFDWSPDSQSITFAYQPRAGDAYTLDSLKDKIGIINLKTHKINNIPYTVNHNSTQPAYSPDGKWIAFQSNPSETEAAKKLNAANSDKPSSTLETITQITRICTFNTTTSQTHCLSNTFNESPVILGWDQSSKNVFVLDSFKTMGSEIYALNLDTSVPAKNLSVVDGFIEPLTVSLNSSHNIFGFSYETTSAAPEAFISATDPFKLKQITHLQSPSTTSLGKTKIIHWKSPDGMAIEGLLVTPPHYDPKKKYPLLVTVHGGPAEAWSKRYLGGCDEYEDMIDPTTCWGNFLSLGFVIFEPNPRGSDGYGSTFRLANFADFGGGDYQDVMSGVDYLIQKGIADPNHLAIAGWSYGGYLTAWAISHSNRFKAAIEGAGPTDYLSFAGTSGLSLFTKGYFGNEFWNDDKLYLQRSPIFYVKNIKTPLLILQGENDPQVPVTQSYELYNALDRQHKHVKMLILPEQGHVPTDANIIYESIKEIDAWLIQALQ